MCGIAGNLYYGIIALIPPPKKKIQENLNTPGIFKKQNLRKKGWGNIFKSA